MKKKVALFFHLENENENEAYKLLESLGRKKSAAIVELLLNHKDEVNLCKNVKRKNIAVTKCLSPVGEKDELVKEKKKEEVLPVYELATNEEIPRNDVNGESDNAVKEKKLNNSLILNGLQSFGL